MKRQGISSSMLSYKRVKFYEEKNYDDLFLKTLEQIRSSDDPLSKNYELRYIDRHVEYGYMYDQDGNIAYMAGVQPFADQVYRIESRTWINPIYRKRMWNPPDNYALTIQQYNNHKYKMIFKSREKSPAGHLRSQKLNDFFKDWILYPEKIELKMKNNWQWIMYKGDVNEVKNILYKA